MDIDYLSSVRRLEIVEIHDDTANKILLRKKILRLSLHQNADQPLALFIEYLSYHRSADARATAFDLV